MTPEGRGWGRLVIRNPLNIIGSPWMKAARRVWHLIQLKENNFLLKQLCASADQRDVLRRGVDPGAQGLLGNIWKLHIRLQTSQIKYEVVY